MGDFIEAARHEQKISVEASGFRRGRFRIAEFSQGKKKRQTCPFINPTEILNSSAPIGNLRTGTAQADITT